MGYRNDVAEFKRIAKRSEADQWRMAELTWTNVEAGTSRRQWARDVGCNERHVRVLYGLWDRWGADALPHRPTFWDAYRKVQFGDDDATDAGKRADRSIKAASPAALVKAIKASPEARRALAADDRLYGEIKMERFGHDTSPAGRKAAEARAHEATAPIRRASMMFGAQAVAFTLDSADAQLEELVESGELDGKGLRVIRAAYDRFTERLVLAEAELDLRR